jgi:hypothetical protein
VRGLVRAPTGLSLRLLAFPGFHPGLLSCSPYEPVTFLVRFALIFRFSSERDSLTGYGRDTC